MAKLVKWVVVKVERRSGLVFRPVGALAGGKGMRIARARGS